MTDKEARMMNVRLLFSREKQKAHHTDKQPTEKKRRPDFGPIILDALAALMRNQPHNEDHQRKNTALDECLHSATTTTSWWCDRRRLEPFFRRSPAYQDRDDGLDEVEERDDNKGVNNDKRRNTILH